MGIDVVPTAGAGQAAEDPHTTQGTSIRCPFHVDTNPSGSVFRNPSTGHWFFKCQSSRCGVAGTILDVARHLHGFPGEATTLRHLFAQYRITINTGWKEKQRALLDGNIAVLNDLSGWREKYQNLYRFLWRVRHDLISKLRWFRDHVESEKLRVGDEAIFFASLRQFHRLAAKKEEHPKYFNRQNEKVDRYCLLGLLRKVADHDLPEGLPGGGPTCPQEAASVVVRQAQNTVAGDSPVPGSIAVR
jgi:hypothetical protein